MNETLRPRERIRKRRDFIFLYKKGRRYKGKYFTLIHLSREFEFSRIAVVASKKVGNAVKRNKIKRRIRALFRTHKTLLNEPKDLIIIVHREIQKARWPELKEEYINALKMISR
jgi:ribonuclease P protein component